MNCRDCKKQVSRKEYTRCNECNTIFRKTHQKEHKCIDCGKELNNFYAKYCHSCAVKGERNPNLKHGKNIINCCIECGSKICAESKRCIKCYGKEISRKLKDRKFSKEHRKNLSKARKTRIISLSTRIKLSLSHGGTGIPYEHRKYNLDFYILRPIILKRDKYICQKCHKKGNIVHHIDYNKQNNKEDNLITLCNRCNLKVNFNKVYWNNFFKNKIIIIQKEII